MRSFLVDFVHSGSRGPPRMDVIWCMVSVFRFIVLFVLNVFLMSLVRWYSHSVITCVIVWCLFSVQYGHIMLHLSWWKCSIDLACISVRALVVCRSRRSYAVPSRFDPIFCIDLVTSWFLYFSILYFLACMMRCFLCFFLLRLCILVRFVPHFRHVRVRGHSNECPCCV